MTTPRSVVLAAHGSTASPAANQPLHALAEAVTKIGNFDRVTPAFLQGEPPITGVLQHLPPGDVVVVPVMTSQGYYQQQLPGLFAQNPDHARFQIEFRSVVGVQPCVVDVVSRRLQGYVQKLEIHPQPLTVLVVGHGTKRSATSADATHALVRELHARHPQFHWVTAFLDQSPTLDEVIGQGVAGPLIVLPFLISLGPHVTVEIPRALGFSPCEGSQFPLVRQAGQPANENFCLCDAPLGLYPELPSIIVEIVNGANP